MPYPLQIHLGRAQQHRKFDLVHDGLSLRKQVVLDIVLRFQPQPLQHVGFPYLPQCHIKDLIHVPSIRQYEQAAEFYSTVFHEAVHSTGTETRLDRPGLRDVNFGSEIYSREELVAEIGAQCILHSLQIESPECIRNSTAYIQNWARKLGEKSNRKWIVTAAVQAEKAVKFILQK